MKAILGIGNPGEQYRFTRHNIGFIILDNFANKHKLVFKPGKGEYYFCESKINSNKFVIVKPTTYVNKSGSAAFDILDKFKIDINDLLVISDDVNLSMGSVRLRSRGGDGGHNGISSLIYSLNSNEFCRLRFGIGDNFEKGDMSNYVLEQFATDQLKQIEPSIEFSTELIEKFISVDYNEMLNHFSKNKSIIKTGN